MKRILISAVFILLAAARLSAAKDYREQTLEQAHALFNSATNSAMYAEAAQQYQYLVKEEGIQNGRLFYTLGNCWFMAGDLGRAILNYRRAEVFLGNDENLQHNLKTALEKRTDLIPPKPPHPLAARLLWWHNAPIQIRWLLFAICWLLFWGAWIWRSKTRKREATVSVAVFGSVSILLLASLSIETLRERNAEPGVITAKEILARQGNGERYAPAFQDPLHSGTEFETVEIRGDWKHIRLADGQTCWIPAYAGESVRIK